MNKRVSALNNARRPAAVPYLAIADDMRQKVADGIWTIGSILPSRRQLAAQYQVNPNTVSRAVERLVQEGILFASERLRTEVVAVPFQRPPDSWSHFRRRMLDASGSSSNVVGIIAREVPGVPAYEREPTIRRSLEARLSEQGLSSRFFGLPSLEANAMEEALQMALRSHVNALAIIYLNHVSGWMESIQQVARQSGVPVFVVAFGMHVPVPHTYVDEQAGGYQAVGHLIEAGYRRLHFLQVFKPTQWMAERIAGAHSAMCHSSLPSASLTVRPPHQDLTWDSWRQALASKDRIETIERLVEAWVQELGGPEALKGSDVAVVAPNDEVAVLMAEGLNRRGIDPGRDVGIIGFDDLPQAAEFGLTSLRPPLVDMAQTAGLLLFDALCGSSLPSQVRMQARLILRESTCRGGRPREPELTADKGERPVQEAALTGHTVDR